MCLELFFFFFLLFFFFQAEDGIRDVAVTGVQTCALPICMYNDDHELLAVGKLAQPLPTSQTTDTTILVNIDR